MMEYPRSEEEKIIKDIRNLFQWFINFLIGELNFW